MKRDQQNSYEYSHINPEELTNNNKRCASSHNPKRNSLPSKTIIQKSTEKPHNTRHISPFLKINSNISIAVSTLPSFLQAENLEQKKNIQQGSSKSSKVIEKTDKRRTNPPYSTKSKTNIGNIREYILNLPNSDDIMLKIKKFDLTVNDLKSFMPESELSANIIDACLKLIKKKNKKISSKDSVINESIYVFSASISEKIFFSDDIFEIGKKNPLKYE